ncbi:PglZ domain-containing protein [Nonomuraea wenchangensis]|uniref:PglZ domain-containing protein n=1 Tax=Nonomuraea wenchangensis TaxID=568860 RepID=A0A1I0LXQ9_9ACTN|nr:PglZ domain-containing protein [Nonomuraea wenchangensis]SEU47609.1 PglZ domain-containing protein [Nonomuraea wenchangensis]
MHPFHDYLCMQLDDALKKRGVVVFYDPRREFEPFIDRELKQVGTGYEGLPRVLVKDRLTFLARHEGSLFALRAAVELIADLDRPEPLIVYLPGVTRDRQASVLMELEKGGICYEPNLKRLALNVLRKRFTDGQIDEMLRPASIGYDDIVSFLHQSEEDKLGSVLRTIFEDAQSEALIACWLADDGKDSIILEKDAGVELFKLVETRLGFSVSENTTVAEARGKVLRYVLVSEFRSDLECTPPASVGMVPEPPSKDHIARIRDVVERLRCGYTERYVALANMVESELNLDMSEIDARHLGNIDTFRFEERALLAYASELICRREYAKGLNIAADRSRSFWVDRDVARQAQWEACRLMAKLGSEIEKTRLALSNPPGNPVSWVRAYSAEDGWFRVDELQRRLETWVAKMGEEPETEKGLALVRREHEELLKKMADGFAKVLCEAAWTVSGMLHQTHIYPNVVQTMGGRVAYFLVDAMRFEMGVELAHQLEGTTDLTIRPAIAALPTITPVGMAALLPGASASFSVVEHKGKIASSIEGTTMSGLSERLKFLKTKVPDVVDLPLGRLLSASPSKLSKTMEDASLVVVRSQEIDALGENVDELTARAAMEGVIGNVARAIRKLASVGIENFVISADHGHQFSIRKDDDMKTDSPGGNTVDIHRRCWIGRGGATPAGTVRVTGAELGYDTNLDFVFPTGLGVFKTGGGLSFHHGSVSLQELVVPVVSLRIPLQGSELPAGKIVELRGVPDQLTNRTFGVRVLMVGDLFHAEPVALRVVLVSGNEQVGQAGMAMGGDLDHASGVLRVNPNSEANLGMMLTRDDCTSVRVVVLDPATDAVLAQSDELRVKLGI